MTQTDAHLGSKGTKQGDIAYDIAGRALLAGSFQLLPHFAQQLIPGVLEHLWEARPFIVSHKPLLHPEAALGMTLPS